MKEQRTGDRVGKTPYLPSGETQRLLDSLPPDLMGLRDVQRFIPVHLILNTYLSAYLDKLGLAAAASLFGFGFGGCHLHHRIPVFGIVERHALHDALQNRLRGLVGSVAVIGPLAQQRVRHAFIITRRWYVCAGNRKFSDFSQKVDNFCISCNNLINTTHPSSRLLYAPMNGWVFYLSESCCCTVNRI